MRATILRYFNVAGADVKLRTGQRTPEATHLIKVASEVAAGSRAQLDIYRHGLSDARRHVRARLYSRDGFGGGP